MKADLIISAILLGWAIALLRTRHPWILLFSSLGVVVAIVVSGLGWLWWSSRPPSDALLEAKFVKHRVELDEIVAMMDQDSHMSRIADDFLWKEDDLAWPRAQARWGISQQRWDQYRSIFRQAGIEHGTNRREKSIDIELIVWTVGLAVAGRSLSYIHCGTPTDGLSHGEPPCIEERDSGSGKVGEEVYRYRRLRDDWFLYDQSD